MRKTQTTWKQVMQLTMENETASKKRKLETIRGKQSMWSHEDNTKFSARHDQQQPNLLAIPTTRAAPSI